MTINLESIEILRERANVSYEEARAALEACDGNVVDALVYLEKQNKLKPPPRNTGGQSSPGFWAAFNKYLKISNETKFVVSKNGSVVLDLPLTIVILLTIVFAPLAIFGFLAALFTNHRIRLEKPGTKDMPINKTFDDMSGAAAKVTEQIKEAINKK
ncbi:MAG: DUF4342 domain-containing protein [Firmicutes bacterium]|nr:DUF4342 domain-containing protein [Bacillota bacterium]